MQLELIMIHPTSKYYENRKGTKNRFDNIPKLWDSLKYIIIINIMHWKPNLYVLHALIAANDLVIIIIEKKYTLSFYTC